MYSTTVHVVRVSVLLLLYGMLVLHCMFKAILNRLSWSMVLFVAYHFVFWTDGHLLVVSIRMDIISERVGRANNLHDNIHGIAMTACAVIMPEIMYGSNYFLSALHQHHLELLQKLQNRAVKAVYGEPPHAHPLLGASPLYILLELFRHKMLCFVLRFVRRCVNGTASVLLENLFGQTKSQSRLQQ